MRVGAVLVLAAIAAFLVPAGADGAVRPAVLDKIDGYLGEQLARAGAGDELVVFVHAGTAGRAARAARQAGLTPAERWDAIGVSVALGTPAAVRAVAAHPEVSFVEADRPIEYHLETAHIATRGEEARGLAQLAAPGGLPYDGSGVTIAVNDSGVDGTHDMFRRPDGSSKVVVNLRDLCDASVCSAPVAVPDSDTMGVGGHGTHVAGIAGGFERTTADGQTVRGSAPGADLMAYGSGVGLTIRNAGGGLNWILQHHADPCGDGSCPPIKVVNNSWGVSGGGNHNPNHAVSKLSNDLVAAGVTVVFSAGNGDTLGNGGDGTSNRVNPYSQNPTPGVISVANYDDANLGTRDGALNGSSSRGLKTDVATYPDVAAPGTLINSACTLAMPICRSNGDVTDPEYAEISGTSMAAPNVAGVVAVLLQANPALTPAQIEDVLEDTAYKFGDPASYVADLPANNPDNTTSFDKGHGLIDVVGALGEVLGATTPVGPSCAPGTGVVDGAGDATDVLVPTNGPPAMSDPDVDITGGSISTDPVTGALTFRIHVDDLRPTGPVGSTGENMRFYFTYEGVEYQMGFSRVIAGAATVSTRFRLQEAVLNGATIADNLVGAFDDTNDVVWATLPANALNVWKPALPVMEAGDFLTGLRLLTQRAIGVGVGVTVTPTADTASGACPYTVGT